GDRQLVGAFLSEFHIEDTAVLAHMAILRGYLTAIRCGDQQAIGRTRTGWGGILARRRSAGTLRCLADTFKHQWVMLEIEQVVGYRCVHADPSVVCGEYGRSEERRVAEKWELAGSRH